MYADQVLALTHQIFAFLNPKYAIVTTPNRDFNVLFPDPIKLRNFDHKFEWTRLEFQKWAEKVCLDYGYTAAFTGVGLYDTRPELGYCTQIALFSRVNCLKPKVYLQGDFELVAEFNYPVKIPLSPRDKVYFQLVYAYNSCVKWGEMDDDMFVKCKSLMNCAGFSRLCDGAKRQALKLVKRTAMTYSDIEVRDDSIRVVVAEEESEEDQDDWL